MQSYRVYFLDADDHIKAVEVITCADDATAKHQAAQLLSERDKFVSVEIWREKDLVHQLRREP